MEIEKAVQKKFQEIAESGKIEKMIEEKLLTSIKSIIDDCLSSYGDFGKDVKEKIKESLKLGNMKLDLPSYNQLVCNWITEIIDKQIIATGKDQIQENLKDFLAPLNIKEIKLSEIVKKFKSQIYGRDSNKIALFIDEKDSSGYFHVHLDKDCKKRKYECSYQIAVNNDGIWAAELKEDNILKAKIHMLHTFEAFIFKLYAAKVKVIYDAGQIDEYLSDDESDYEED